MKVNFVAFLLFVSFVPFGASISLNSRHELRKRVADLRPWPYLKQKVVDILIELEILRWQHCRWCLNVCSEYEVSHTIFQHELSS